MQTITHKLFSDRKRLILCGLLIISILTGTIVMVGHLRPFHASAATTITCAQTPNQQNCDGQDPIAQGCVADAQIAADLPITFIDATVGEVQLRFSPACQSYWGRVFDTRQNVNTNLILVVGTRKALSAPPTFVGSQYRILYSPMVFVGPSGKSPQIQGIIEADGADTFPSATIPAGN